MGPFETLNYIHDNIAILFQQKLTPRECLKKRDGTVPDECYALRQSFYECKHSIVSIIKTEHMNVNIHLRINFCHRSMEDEGSEVLRVTEYCFEQLSLR